MDNEKPADAQPDEDDQSTEDFVEEVENDPSTAKPSESDDDGLGRLRGG